ncbi:MAG: FtsK/SpoIIIE domain-containing protein [Acidimicrobiales bacterium]
MSLANSNAVWFIVLGAAAVGVWALVAIGSWWRHQLLFAALVLWLTARQFGGGVATAVSAGTGVALLSWRLLLPVSFRRLVVIRWIWFGKRRLWYRQHWARLMVGHGLGHERRREGKVTITVPRLRRRIVCNPWSDRLWVRPLIGQSIEDWERQIDALAMAIGSRECRVAIERPGLIRLHVQRADPLAAVVRALPIPAHPADVDLEALPVGVREDGGPWTVRVAGTHLLIAGVTGAGKSSVVWSVVRALAPTVARGTVQLWGIDPKGGMELAPGRPLFARFAAGELDEMAELLDDAVRAMRERAGRYAGHHRRHEASSSEPLLVVVVDEMAFLTAYAGDNKLRDRINKALATLLTQGRAVGVCVVAALQDPRKEVIGYRNLFPTKIALRLDERTQVDMVLGDGARAAGARCDQIPDSMPGVGYVKVDGIREPCRVRAAHVADVDIAELAARYPAPEIPEAA